MKEYLEKFILLFPQYGLNLITVLVSPQKFIREREDTELTREALVFFLMSAVVLFVILTPLGKLPTNTSAAEFGPFVKKTAVIFIGPFVWAISISLSWKIAGTIPDIKRNLAISLYLWGALLPMLLIYILASDGLEGAQSPKTLIDGFALFGFLFLVGWPMSFWGAYKEANQGSTIRSILAAIVALFLCLLVALIYFYIILAYTP